MKWKVYADGTAATIPLTSTLIKLTIFSFLARDSKFSLYTGNNLIIHHLKVPGIFQNGKVITQWFTFSHENKLYALHTAECKMSIQCKQSITYLECKNKVTVKTCLPSRRWAEKMVFTQQELPPGVQGITLLAGLQKAYSSRLGHPELCFILHSRRPVVLLGECEGLLCIIINKISRIIS